MFDKKPFYAKAALILLAAAYHLAAPAIASAQTPLLAGPRRSALMVQLGADWANIDHKAGSTELMTFDNQFQPWGAVTAMLPAASGNASVLLGVAFASVNGSVHNSGKFSLVPGTISYLEWDQTGYRLQLQVGTIIWFK